jgi:Ala-tRNA(Pro) deacylase
MTDNPSTDRPAPTAGVTLPTSPAQLLARLEALGIAHESHRHEPVFTVEEAKRRRGELPGAHIKNLFLRNKKGRMWLVVLDEDRQVDLAGLAVRLGAGRFSFGSPERLLAHLGVLPGAVTPLSLVNDREGQVQPVIDAAILRHGPVNCHPLTNDMTTAIAPGDLLRFIAACGHRPEIVDFDEG